MGVIKDGEVSGIIPSNEVFTVYYPGYPSSMSRAIQTLGGTEAILKVRSSQSNKLELHFRPEDPYSHPAFGELRACNNLLLKITKRKPSSSLGSSSSANEPETELQVKPELSADIVGRIPDFYQFEGMVDYQHVVAVHADTALKKKRSWTEMKQPHFEKGGLMDLDQEDVVSLVPPLFSLKDIPVNLALKLPAISSSRRKQEEAVHCHFEMNLEPSLALPFNIKEIPKEINWKAVIAVDSDLYVWQMAVAELFEERPIWPKDALTERLLVKNLKFTIQTLRRLLVAVAYYFIAGPFLRFWIRKGYDPRKDSDSRIYQRLDFRVPPQLRSFSDDSAADSLRHKWEDLCKFQVFPYKFQTLLQLCELDDDYIQQEIKKPPKRTTCTYGTGWFLQQVHDSFRFRVMMRFLSVYPKLGAAKLLKAASEDFEKSKRACMYKGCLKPAEEEHQKIDKEVIVDEANENGNDIDEGEADDIEADDPEDELDAYEALDLAGEDDETSLQSHSYMENNSRSYLQDLFDSFPSPDAGDGKKQDVDSSDGEYHIYEQDDDEDYPDDDDD
ncbi:uncharacterized protein [Euphorbia lathyris]|uniref:uncharacterized protein n=1 Tax=Euphorbia lathyris TaxID=212925 RepID=UPI003314140F